MNRTVGILLVLLVVLGAAVYMNAQRQDGMAWQDGEYKGKSQRDERGAYGSVEIEVRGGKIVKANYDEFNEDGSRKDESYPYQPAVTAQGTFEDRLLETQDPTKVDNVSGATETWHKFKEASRDALEKAK
ncbi:MAG TPA: FMN-binding protein [Firmicutes bacterium]|nr:FMN-binding protein [Bacillota bacterium]